MKIVFGKKDRWLEYKDWNLFLYFGNVHVINSILDKYFTVFGKAIPKQFLKAYLENPSQLLETWNVLERMFLKGK